MSIKTNHAQDSLTPDSGVLVINANGALALPSGQNADRPLTPLAGHVRFDQTSVIPEYYSGTAWESFAAISYVDAQDQNLQNQINNIVSNADPVALDSLTEIVQAFQNADGSLIDAITALSSTLSSDLAQEIANRTAEDENLFDTISTVIESYQEADQREEDARIAGDQQLQDNLNSVEASLQLQINSILSNLDPAALDSLSEIVEAFQNADTGILATINSLIQANTDALNAEVTRATAAEQALQDAIDEEHLHHTNAEVQLQNNIDAEVTRATAAEQALQSTINNFALDNLTDVVINTPTDGQVISYDSSIGEFRNQTHQFNLLTKNYVGDSSTTSFSLNETVASQNNLVVSVNGILQQPGYSYTLVNGDTLVFDEVPESGDLIEVRIIKSTVTNDRPRPTVTGISYSTIGSYTTISITATDITFGTGARIDDDVITRIDYPTSNTMQLMIETSKMTSSVWNNPRNLTLVDTSGNEFVFTNLINYGVSKPSWTNSNSYIGTFSGGDTINFALALNNATSITINPAYAGESAISWLTISGNNIVGTAPQNSSPSRYEISVTATNGSVNITKNFWLMVL